jgi:phosphatidylserine synthase
MRLFNPISATAIGVVFFTGVVMMAAKHLDFTIENIVMILFVVTIMILEGKRASKLKWINLRTIDALQNYKKYVIKIFIIEIVLVLSVSVWMWSIL